MLANDFFIKIFDDKDERIMCKVTDLTWCTSTYTLDKLKLKIELTDINLVKTFAKGNQFKITLTDKEEVVIFINNVSYKVSENTLTFHSHNDINNCEFEVILESTTKTTILG